MAGAVRNEPIHQTSTLAALQSPAFRLYFIGQLVSVSGSWMQAVAQQIVVYNLTQSEMALGLVACAQGLPALVLTPFAGPIIERFPRRQIIIFTQTIMMILAFILAALEFAHQTQVWHIVVLAMALGAMNSLDAPARQSFLVEMAGKEQLTSAIILQAIMFNAARVFGPALAGLLLKLLGPETGPAWLFFFNGASFLAVLISLILMVVPYARGTTAKLLIFRPLREGLLFSRRHGGIWPLLMLAFFSSIFGLTYAVLIPAFADLVFADTSGGTAAMSTAQGVGAILAGIFVAHTIRRALGGKTLGVLAIAANLFVLAITVSRTYPPVLLFSALAGFCTIGQFITLNTLIQKQVPDEFRGRVLSLYTLTFFGFQPFSALVIGIMAQSIGTIQSMQIYGVIGLLASLALLWRFPQIWELR